MRTPIPALALALLGACAAPGAPARPTHDADRAAVLEVVQGFFDVMVSRDVEAAARLVVPEGVFVNVRTLDGVRVVRHFDNAGWAAGLAAREAEWSEAWDGEPTVLIDGDVAVVWGRYTFDVDGARSHTGTDAFCLVRSAEGWRLAGGVYSVER